jgi:MYXO-CTERM domain-containing protein
MHRATILLTLLLAACAAADPPAVGSSSGAIINGSFDYGMDPAVVLVNDQNKNDQNTGSCTGTFITRKVVLTAGHCIVEGSPDHWYIWRADTYDQQTGKFTGLVESTPYKSVKGVTPPDFDLNQFKQGTVTGDVGLILVDRPLAAEVNPMPLTPYRVAAKDIGQPVRFIGFGIRDPNTLSSVLEKLEATTPLGFITDQTLGWNGGEFNVCSGDSGGPSLITYGGVEYVVADTSGHLGTCGSDSLMQRADVYRDFILQFIAANDPQPTTHCGADGVCGTGCTAPDPDCPCAGDGMCTTACTDPDHDPDCAEGCGADGQCQRTGCPAPDPDCGHKQTGETCTTSNDCDSNWCVPSGATKICVPTCDASGGCPSGYSCAHPSNVCMVADSGGGCAVGTGPGGALGGWLALAVAAFAARRRRRS